MGEYNRTRVFVRLLSAKTLMRKRNFIEKENVKKGISCSIKLCESISYKAMSMDG